MLTTAVAFHGNVGFSQVRDSGQRSERQLEYVRHARESRLRMWRNLTTEGSIQEARHKNETQLKSEDKILNRTRKRKRTRQS